MKTYMNPKTIMMVTTETLMQSFGVSGNNPLEFQPAAQTSQDNAL